MGISFTSVMILPYMIHKQADIGKYDFFGIEVNIIRNFIVTMWTAREWGRAKLWPIKTYSRS